LGFAGHATLSTAWRNIKLIEPHAPESVKKGANVELLLNTIMLEPNRWTADKKLSWPLIDLLKPVQLAGFRQLEIWQYHISNLTDEQVEAVQARMQALEMQVVAVGAYPQFHHQDSAAETFAAELQRTVEVSATLGANVFKIFPGRVASADAEDTVRELTLQRLRRLASDVGEHGMILTLETHGGTLCDNRAATDRLLEDLADVENLAICFQPYVEDDTQATIDFYDSIAHRVHHLHLQNRLSAKRQTVCLADGDWVDYRRLLPHVRDSGFDGIVCLEFTAGITPAEGETFALEDVIGHAVTDRGFVHQVWAI